MILTDTGPLVAMLDDGEREHARCIAELQRLGPPMLTTWPAFTEAMYLVNRRGGWPAQQALWKFVENAWLEIAGIDERALSRMRSLMESYRDIPMSLADASLVVVAEDRRLDRIFTLDSDFRAYRLIGGRWLTVIP
ncbi:MAG: type II toxin-antitoxin system VapC family toxin [Chloroflexota bacterium]